MSSTIIEERYDRLKQDKARFLLFLVDKVGETHAFLNPAHVAQVKSMMNTESRIFSFGLIGSTLYGMWWERNTLKSNLMYRLTLNVTFTNRMFKFFVIPLCISSTLARFYLNYAWPDLEQMGSSYDFNDDKFKTIVIEKMEKLERMVKITEEKEKK